MKRSLRALLPAGIRWRLTGWVAVLLLASAALTFVVVYRATGQQLTSEIERDLRTDTDGIAQSLRLLAGSTPAEITQAARRYLAAEPYRVNSTLRFVTVGSTTVSNHPELLPHARPEHDEAAAEQARENAAARALLIPRNGLWTGYLPDVGPMRIRESSLSLGGVRIRLAAGAPLAVVQRSQDAVAQAFIFAGALALVLALLASYLAGAGVSAPLRRMARAAARVDEGELGTRLALEPEAGAEIRVLAEAFNHMLDRLAGAFDRQRHFVADASHELRTPLTVIRGQLEVLASREHPPAEEVRRVERLVQAEIVRVARLVDDLLLLVSSEQPDFLRPEMVYLPTFVAELWEGLRATAERRFHLAEVPAGSLHCDPDRLAQALQNLVRNAIEHTRPGTGLVSLEVEALEAGRVRFTVLDDGPGVAPEDRNIVFERFRRTDAARNRAAGGTGLGLAITRAIARAHEGTVHVAASEHEAEGARLELTLPGFHAQRPVPGPGYSALSSHQ